MLSYFFDTSLKDFLSELNKHIKSDYNEKKSIKTLEYNVRKNVYADIGNISFIKFVYHKINKNKLYMAIINYEKNGAIFYSKNNINNSEFIIKSIKDIKTSANYVSLGENIKGVIKDGTYNLEFTVYYEKK